jgi:hypothetical protein
MRWKSAQIVVVNDRQRIFIQQKEVIPVNEIESLLNKLYNDPTIGGNLGRDKFDSRIKEKYVGISRSDISKFLFNDEIHQLYKPVHRLKIVKPFPVPSGPNLYWHIGTLLI